MNSRRIPIQRAAALFLGTLLGVCASGAETESNLTAGPLQAIRESAKPGWRTEALEWLEQHASALRTNAPSLSSGTRTALIQEAIVIFGTPEVAIEPWKPATGTLSAWIDLETKRSIQLAASGEITVHDLDSGAVKTRYPASTPRDRRLVRFDSRSGWLASINDEGRWSFRLLSEGTNASSGAVIGTNLLPNQAPRISIHPEFSRFAIAGPKSSAPGLQFAPLPPQGDTGLRAISLPASPTRFEFSPSGTRLATLCDGLSALMVIHPALDQVESQIPLDAVPTDLSWVPDARQLLVATPAGIRRVDTQEKTATPFGPPLEEISALAVSDNGALLALARSGPELEVWDSKSIHPIASVELTGSPIERIQWSPRAVRLVVQQKDEAVPRLISFSVSRDLVHLVPTGEKVVTNTPPASVVRWEKDGVWLVRTNGGEIRLPNSDNLQRLGLSPNGAWLHLHREDGSVEEWNLPAVQRRLARYGLVW